MSTYTNESPVNLENINSDTGILVIAFSPEDPNDKPSVHYYSSKEELDAGWAGNECPLTKQSKYMEIPLSQLSKEDLASLVLNEAEEDVDATLAEGGFDNFTEDSYVRRFFPRVLNKIRSGLEVQRILDRFRDTIHTIGEHHGAAQQRAWQLYDDLTQLSLYELEYTILDNYSSFAQEAGRLIEKAIPELDRDLGWGDRLRNLLKELCNAVTQFFSAGYHQGFFAVKSFDASRVAIDLGAELERYSLSAAAVPA